MADVDIFASYVAGIEALLTPPSPELATMTDRAGESVKPPSPFDDAQIEQAQRLLAQQPQLVLDLLNRWQAATTAHNRSVEEVRILGAAAADLAMAERLLSGAVDQNQLVESVERSGTTGGDEDTIRMALTDPESLFVVPDLPVFYRGTDEDTAVARQFLLAATADCLESIKQGATDASADAITGLLSKDLLILKQAAEFISTDLVNQLQDISMAVIRSAVEFLLSATDKLKLLLGPDVEAQVVDGILDLIDKLGDGESVNAGIGKLLGTGEIYTETSAWIRDFGGTAEVIEPLTTQIAALQGSYAGRVKVLRSIAKGLAIAGRLLALGAVTLAWAPLAIIGAYVVMVAYALYSAFDHIDSSRFPYFNRVEGVRIVLQNGLAIAPAAS